MLPYNYINDKFNLKEINLNFRFVINLKQLWG